MFDVSVPQNWKAVSSSNAVKFVPQNGYGVVEGGQSVFTHGVELGVARASSRDLRDATHTLVANFARSNPDLRQTSDPRDVRLSQRSGLAMSLVNRSHLGGTERIGIYTTFLADGNLFYVATIVPDEEAARYAPGVRSDRGIDPASRREVGAAGPRTRHARACPDTGRADSGTGSPSRDILGDLQPNPRSRSYGPDGALRTHSDAERARTRSRARGDQEGDDRPPRHAHRRGGAQEGEDPLPAGALLRAVLLRRAGDAVVSPHRTGT